MTEHNLFYYPYASFTNAQLPLLKVAALYVGRSDILDQLGAYHTFGMRSSFLKDAGMVQKVTPTHVLAKWAGPDDHKTNILRDYSTVFRAAVVVERHQLIKSQLELYAIV